MSDETVTLPKGELFEMLDILDEMVRFCSVSMPADRYYATGSAVWVLAHRAAGDDVTAEKVKSRLMSNRKKWLRKKRIEARKAVAA